MNDDELCELLPSYTMIRTLRMWCARGSREHQRWMSATFSSAILTGMLKLLLTSVKTKTCEKARALQRRTVLTPTHYFISFFRLNYSIAPLGLLDLFMVSSHRKLALRHALRHAGRERFLRRRDSELWWILERRKKKRRTLKWRRITT